ncbi:MAG: hypothetical protein P8M10_04250 [Ilumatobacter sp.]|nr:hypothetical protein [Ilumatobacter sp.]
MDATRLAEHGNFVSSSAGRPLGVSGYGNGVDNRLPSCRMMPSVLVLIAIRVQAVERSFGDGLVYTFAEDGTLLATASQRVIVRLEGLKPSR